MSLESIQAIVGTAITDRQFMHDLLNSKRASAIARFDLTPEERSMISGIEANSIEQFACQLDEWLVQREQDAYLTPVPTLGYRYEPTLTLS